MPAVPSGANAPQWSLPCRCPAPLCFSPVQGARRLRAATHYALRQRGATPHLVQRCPCSHHRSEPSLGRALAVPMQRHALPSLCVTRPLLYCALLCRRNASLHSTILYCAWPCRCFAVAATRCLSVSRPNFALCLVKTPPPSSTLRAPKVIRRGIFPMLVAQQISYLSPPAADARYTPFQKLPGLDFFGRRETFMGWKFPFGGFLKKRDGIIRCGHPFSPDTSRRTDPNCRSATDQGLLAVRSPTASQSSPL